MPTRPRMVNPKTLEDNKFISLSDKGRLMWFGLILNADDLGRGKGDIQSLKNKIFPHNRISLKKVEKIRQEIKKKMNKNTTSVKFYRAEGQEFYQLTRWEKYQYYRKDRVRTSDYPSPPNSHPSPKRQSGDSRLSPPEEKRKDTDTEK